MGTKSNPGKFDCYANAGPDEPIFVLLGRDRHAAGLVRLWALLRAKTGEDDAVVFEALQCAKAMDNHIRATKGLTVADTSDNTFERLFEQVTEGMLEHPEAFDHSCTCALCLSYGEEDSQP
jgi:hypothetical protein